MLARSEVTSVLSSSDQSKEISCSTLDEVFNDTMRSSCSHTSRHDHVEFSAEPSSFIDETHTTDTRQQQKSSCSTDGCISATAINRKEYVEPHTCYGKLVRDSELTYILKYYFYYPILLRNTHGLLTGDIAQGLRDKVNSQSTGGVLDSDGQMRQCYGEINDKLIGKEHFHKVVDVYAWFKRLWKRRYYSLLDTVIQIHKDYSLLHKFCQGKHPDHPVTQFCSKFVPAYGAQNIDSSVLRCSNPAWQLNRSIQQLFSNIDEHKEGHACRDQLLVSSAFLQDVMTQCEIQRRELDRRLQTRARLKHIIAQARKQTSTLEVHIGAQTSKLQELMRKTDNIQADVETDQSKYTPPNTAENGPEHKPQGDSKEDEKSQGDTRRVKDMRDRLSQLQNRTEELERILKAEETRRKLLHNKLQDVTGNIRVYCRVRPVESTRSKVNRRYLTVDNDKLYIRLNRDEESSRMVTNRAHFGDMEVGDAKCFLFDRVFKATASQQQVFDEVEDMVVSCVDGYNVCILAYGQTGSGKTYTMIGSQERQGVNLRAIYRLLQLCNERPHWTYHITVSMLEVYQEEVFDLLCKKVVNSNTRNRVTESSQSTPNRSMGERLIGPKWMSANTKLLGQRSCGYSEELRKWRSQRKAVRIVSTANGNLLLGDIVRAAITTEQDVPAIIRRGEECRRVSATDLNSVSSRSHLIMMLCVDGENRLQGTRTHGTLMLTDLAGSENISRSGSVGQRFQEATCINKSLSCLGRVFDAIRQRRRPPFRETKLTQLLMPTLVGPAKCLLVVTVRGEPEHAKQTLRTVKFGQGALSVASGQPAPALSDAAVRIGTPFSARQNRRPWLTRSAPMLPIAMHQL